MAFTATFLCVLFLLFAALPIQAQPACPPGEIPANGRCKQCPIGTYRKNRTTCTPCPPGTSQPNTGAVGEDLCRQCTPGTYSDITAAPTCQPCPEGTTSNFGSTKCSKCGPGTRASMYGTGCETCEMGTYSTGVANMRCEYCPWPLSSEPGSSSLEACKPCPPGEHSQICTTCSKGFFKGPGMDRCYPCPPGTTTESYGARSESACIPCPKGTFFGLRARKCRRCKNGTVSNGPGATICRAPGEPCFNDFFENESKDCIRCPGGWIYVPGEKRCERCPSGSVSRGGKQTKCVKCTGVLLTNLENSKCECPQGMFMVSSKKCLPCPAGSDITDDIHTHKSCFKCSLGTFKKRAGKHLCERCPYGMVATEEGSTKCTKCPEGTMPDIDDQSEPFLGSAQCVSVRTRCPLGYRRRLFGVDRSFSGCRRVPCQLDTPNEDINVTCAPCDKGQRLVNRKCRRCRRREVSAGGVISSCTSCENGLFQDERDRSKCSCYGYFALGFGIQNGVCSKCPPGSFGAYTSEVCQSCSAGTFARAVGTERCQNCPLGTVSGKGAVQCKKCPKGTLPNRRIRGTRCVSLAQRAL